MCLPVLCFKCTLLPGRFDWQRGEPIKSRARATHSQERGSVDSVRANITNSVFMLRLLSGPETRATFNVLARLEVSMMSTQSGADSDDNRSIHSANIAEVHDVPMQVIIRPIPPVLDELKVQSLMETIKVINVWL